MSTFNIQLPNITEGSLDSAKERRAIIEALYQVNEQLRYVLNNIGEDNLSTELQTKIETAGDNQALTQRVEDAENGLSSFRRQTAEGFQQVVRKDSVISSINQSAEAVSINAGKISLTGYVSINGEFSVDESGSMRSSGGTIGGWYIDESRIMALSGVGAGSMILDSSTSTIAGGLISGTELRGNIIYGSTIYGSNGIYMGYNNGVIDMGAAYIEGSTVGAARVTSLQGGNLYLMGGGNTLQVGSGDLGYPFVMDGALSVNGAVSCVEVVTSSDERKKFDIAQLSDEAAAEIISALNPVTFRYVLGDTDRKHYGFIAQEVPEELQRKAADGYLALNYSEIIAPLVRTVQQQERRIAALEERLAKLEVG